AGPAAPGRLSCGGRPGRPFTPGFVGGRASTGQLAEIGVMLLMFDVGLHFSADDLTAVRAIAIPSALAQIVIATAIGAGMAGGWVGT
ncbi:MAG: cation:proton antiporter, partial [Terrimicrobiaceae bacterium]